MILADVEPDDEPDRIRRKELEDAESVEFVGYGLGDFFVIQAPDSAGTQALACDVTMEARR